MTMHSGRGWAAIVGSGLAIFGIALPAKAQTAGNAEFQEYFRNTVCNNPSGRFLNRCLETFDPSKPEGDPDRFANISSDSESSLNPSQIAIAASNALARAEALAAETQERLETIRDEEGGKPGASGSTIAGFGPWSIFASFQGEWFAQDRPSFVNERGFDGNRFRGTIGADYRLGSGSRVGLMGSYEDYSLTFDREPVGINFAPLPNAGGAKSKSLSFAVFGTFNITDGIWSDLSAGMGWSDNEFRRNAIFQPGTRTFQREVNAIGSADGSQYFAGFGLGYDHVSGPLSIGPYVRGRYMRSKINAYTEEDLNDTGLHFTVSEQRATSLTGVLGANVSYAVSASWGVVLPQVRLEYEHEFQDDARAVLTGFALDPNDLQFAVVSDAPDRNYFNAGIGLLFVLPHGIMPFVEYEALLGYTHFNRHRIAAGLRIEL